MQIENTPQNPLVQTVRIAVRALAETVHRTGGLAGPAYSGVSSADGIRLHQRFIRLLNEKHPDSPVTAEAALNAAFAAGDFELLINGRCDALLDLPDGPLIIEAKSFTGPAELLPPNGEAVHWAQANLYAWLYLETHPDLQEIRVGLAYLAAESAVAVELQRLMSRDNLAGFFQKTCHIYLEFTGNQLKSQQLREISGRSCRFPYPGLRAGQKLFMREVIGAARQKGTVFIQAPTGTGKTMAALYPAVKAVANHLADHVFYLTAMTSTRLVAARALEDLRRTGLHMKGIVLYAKEKLCLEPALYCDSRKCPYATAYYDHLPDALRQLFLLESISQEEILDCARHHQVCPFELSLDIALYCEIIICDYNYAFDPRVKLERFFGQDCRTQLLLVDEAHNLPARSREMFSSALDSDMLTAAQSVVRGQSPALERSLGAVQAYMTLLAQALGGNDPGFDQVEKGAAKNTVMIAEKFRAMRELPATLLSHLGRFGFLCRQFLDQHPDLTGRRSLLDFYFSALFFCRVAEEFHDPTYVTTVQLTGSQLILQLMCLDASEKLALAYRNQHPTVFFSATLSPVAYYIGLLHGDVKTARPQTLLLGTPFPPENLLVMVCSQLSTKFKQRQETVQPIWRMILQAVSQRVGNYLVFVPSFSYMSMLRNLIRACPERTAMDWMFQSADMSEALRRKFLRRFEVFGEKTLVAVAVMGGVFSEGIDLVGEKLAGVVIVGVGLPQICPEREIMKQYYMEALGSGYEYAYLYPGFNKVQQAAGRVIRTENDRGFILLIDDRYATPVYTELFPSDWQPVTVADADELKNTLQNFWLT
jgi:DNA excision repair protein ERCC-2